MRPAIAALALLLFACSSRPPNDSVLASPDRKHALFFSTTELARSVDVTTGQEVARAQGLVPGVFSRNGQVLLTWKDDGHLVTLRVGGGKPFDLGPSIDRGRISDDGKHVAYLATASACSIPEPQSITLPLVCGEIRVVSSDGGPSTRVGSGVRIWVDDRNREDGILDDYQFAGDDFIVFDDETGALSSTPVDGSTPPFQIAPRLGQAAANDLNVPVAWRLLVDGRVFFRDFEGTHLAGPDGHDARLIDTEQGLPYCGIHPDGLLSRCAVSSDGKSVLLSYADPYLIEVDGKITVNPHAGERFWLKQVSLADPAGAKVRLDSARPETIYAADDAPVFYEPGGDLVRLEADGTRRVLLPFDPGKPSPSIVQYEAVSGDLRWALFDRYRDHVSTSDACVNCTYGTFVSLLDGSRWEPKDANGDPLLLWQAGWSPDSTRVLIIGPVGQVNDYTGGTLYVASASGGALTQVAEHILHFTWVDEHHAVVEGPDGVFVRGIP